MTYHPQISTEFVLGRKPVRERFHSEGEVTVSVYRNRRGIIFYAGPINPNKQAKKSVMYRIRVRAKNETQ